MDLRLFSSVHGVTGAAEYLKAKLRSEISPFEVSQTLERDPGSVLIVDVRDRAAYEREHIRGAINVPAAELVHVLASLPKDGRIVTYCWDVTCALAPQAALELLQKGYDARYLVGGIEEWKRKGFTLEKALHSEQRF